MFKFTSVRVRRKGSSTRQRKQETTVLRALASSGVVTSPFFVKIFIVCGLEKIFAAVSAYLSGILGRAFFVFLR